MLVDIMKKAFGYLMLAVLSVLIISFTMHMAKASSISVGTYDAVTGEPKDVFSSSESVRIIAQSSHKPLTITVKDSDGDIVGSETVDSYTYNKTWNNLTQKHGWYTIEASSPMSTEMARASFATVFFNVVPEAPLGTVSIALGMISAFGFYGLVKRRKNVNL